MKRAIYCTVPQPLIKEPLLFTLGKRFNVVPNIRGASVTDEVALLALELEGEESDVNAAVEYLSDQGVQVEELEEGRERPF